MYRINLLGALLMAAHVASAQTPAAPTPPKAKPPQPQLWSLLLHALLPPLRAWLQPHTRRPSTARAGLRPV